MSALVGAGVCLFCPREVTAVGEQVPELIRRNGVTLLSTQAK